MIDGTVLPNARNQPDDSVLPAALSSFIGRKRELVVLLRLLRDPSVRLLTITGAGGVGKTRTAQYALMRLRATSSIPPAVIWVSLASVAKSGEVPGTIARSAGVAGDGNLSLAERIRLLFDDRSVLLVLDTFEHVLDARPVVTELLNAVPHLRIIVTSRVPLRLSGEQIYRLPPMIVPTDGSRAGERIGKADAVRFFVARAASFDPRFSLTAEDELTVATICRRLDGLPLAMELAAARIGLFPVDELLRRLDRRLPLLVGGPHDAPERHRTLRAAISWSYELLGADEQRLFRWLSLFAGSFPFEFAEQIAATWANQPVLDLVAALVDASLMQRLDTESPARFAMLDTIREFGLEQLGASGELSAASSAHAKVMRRFALDLEPQLQPSADLFARLRTVDQELENVRAALRWFEHNDPNQGSQLFSALAQYWLRRSMWRESRDWNERLIAHPELSPVQRVRLQIDLARAMNYQFDFSRPELSSNAYALACELGDVVAQLDALLVQITAGVLHGDSELAKARIAAARQTLERAPEPERTSRGLTIDLFGAMVQARLDPSEESENAIDRSLVRANASGDSMRAALLYWSRSALQSRRGDVAAARHSLRLAFERFSAGRELWSMGGVVGDLALGYATDQPLAFARLIGFCSRLYGLCGLTAPAAARPEYACLRAQVVDAIGEETVQNEQQHGAHLSIEDGIRYVLELTAAARDRPASAPALSSAPITADGRPLSPRQLEVLRLIAAGRSDREIALALGISYRTTTTYVAAILARLKVPSRAAAAAWAARNGVATTNRASSDDISSKQQPLP